MDEDQDEEQMLALLSLDRTDVEMLEASQGPVVSSNSALLYPGRELTDLPRRMKAGARICTKNMNTNANMNSDDMNTNLTTNMHQLHAQC